MACIASGPGLAVVQRSKLVEFLKDTDVLILDTQYTDEKYQEHIGGGMAP